MLGFCFFYTFHLDVNEIQIKCMKTANRLVTTTRKCILLTKGLAEIILSHTPYPKKVNLKD